jgi:hypothetical protein
LRCTVVTGSSMDLGTIYAPEAHNISNAHVKSP